MPVRRRERSRDRLLVWTFALGLVLVLTGLFVATSESLRRQEHSMPLTGVVQPDLPLAPPVEDDTHHGPSSAGWRVP